MLSPEHRTEEAKAKEVGGIGSSCSPETSVRVEEDLKAPSPFLPGTLIQYAFDSTSLGLFKTCPKLYHYVIIMGYRPKDESVHLRFGIEYHQALQEYDSFCASGIGYDDAVRDTIRALLTRTASWKSDHKYKNRDNLIRTVIWYLEKFRDDPAITVRLSDGRPATEVSFRFELDWGPKSAIPFNYGDEDQKELEAHAQPYLLCGHLDRLVDFQDSIYVMDRKAQPVTTSVLGLNGWIEIGQLQVGDSIAGKDGNFYPIKGLHPKGITKTYEVTFNDRTSVRCAEDHIWTVGTQFLDVWQDMTMNQIITAPSHIKFHIPLVQPVQHPETDLPLNPYVLGTLLGNGYLNGNSISLSTSDEKLAAGAVHTARHTVVDACLRHRFRVGVMNTKTEIPLEEWRKRAMYWASEAKRKDDEIRRLCEYLRTVGASIADMGDQVGKNILHRKTE